MQVFFFVFLIYALGMGSYVPFMHDTYFYDRAHIFAN